MICNGVLRRWDSASLNLNVNGTVSLHQAHHQSWENCTMATSIQTSSLESGLRLCIENENWRGKNDPTERRRIQNRLNQRAFRQRQRSGDHQTKQYRPRSDCGGPFSPRDDEGEEEEQTSPFDEEPPRQGHHTAEFAYTQRTMKLTIMKVLLSTSWLS